VFRPKKNIRQENAAEYSADNEYSAQERKRCKERKTTKKHVFLGLQLPVSVVANGQDLYAATET
jgi:hypothetical protein